MAEKLSSIVVGTQQSPINIISGETIYAPALETGLVIEYLDETAIGTINEAEENFVLDPAQHFILKFRGVSYELAKIHFHSGSEHQLDGASLATYEMHLVHTLPGSNDKLALGLFFNESDKARARPSLAKLTEAFGQMLPSKKRAKTTKVSEDPCNKPKISVVLNELLNTVPTEWFHYQGSLTTYPFSEDVTWVVDRNVGSVKPANVAALVGAVQHVRVVQPLNRRYVLRNFDVAAKRRAK